MGKTFKNIILKLSKNITVKQTILRIIKALITFILRLIIIISNTKINLIRLYQLDLSYGLEVDYFLS